MSPSDQLHKHIQLCDVFRLLVKQITYIRKRCRHTYNFVISFNVPNSAEKSMSLLKLIPNRYLSCEYILRSENIFFSNTSLYRSLNFLFCRKYKMCSLLDEILSQAYIHYCLFIQIVWIYLHADFPFNIGCINQFVMF